MKRSELLKQKPVLVPTGNGGVVTHFEDAAGHKYEYDKDGGQYRILVHSETGTESPWLKFEPETGDKNSTSQGSIEGLVGSTDVATGGQPGDPGFPQVPDGSQPAKRAPGTSGGDPELEAQEADADDEKLTDAQLDAATKPDTTTQKYESIKY